MTEAEALTKLVKLADARDIEAAHGEADDILAEFVKSLGFKLVVKAYDSVPKWYA